METVTLPSFLVSFGGYVMSWLGISYGIHRLFEKAEEVLNQETKKSVTRWLKNLDVAEKVHNWPQAFAENFDAVFGKKHRSWKCFFRSCLASTLASVIVIFIWVWMRPDEFFSVWHNEDFMTQLILFPILLALLNFLPDYLSLLETRYIIKRMTKTISLKIRLSLLLFDVILTGGIALSIVPAFMTLTGSEPLGTSFLNYFEEVLPLTNQNTAVFMGTGPIFSICFYTSFFTSVWIWLYVLAGMLVKVGDRFNILLSRFRKMFDVNKKPLSSLGFVSMLIITILYLAVPVAIFSKGFWQTKQRIINAGTVTTTTIDLRKTPGTLTEEDVSAMLAKNGFFDRFWNNSGKGIKHAYELQASGKVVYDGATNLYWQQAGSDAMRNYDDAENYIKKLNEDKFAGVDNWRLPTLEEAMSLVENERKYRPGYGYYIDGIFDKTQWRIWTVDKESASRAWVVYFFDGGCSVDLIDFSFLHVRAVR